MAGVRLCASLPLGVSWVGHIELIEHVAQKGGRSFVQSLDGVLRRTDLTEAGRRGVLRLAGFVGSSAFSTGLRESWAREVSRMDLLAELPVGVWRVVAGRNPPHYWNRSSMRGQHSLTRVMAGRGRLA